MSRLSYTGNQGKANMVDVGDKPQQVRIAVATGHIRLNNENIKQVKENQIIKQN